MQHSSQECRATAIIKRKSESHQAETTTERNNSWENAVTKTKVIKAKSGLKRVQRVSMPEAYRTLTQRWRKDLGSIQLIDVVDYST